MSYVALPDPHPGRCSNFRERYTPDRGIERHRCLGLEGEEHVCSFDPWPPRIAPTSWHSTSTATPPPEPWVPRPPSAADAGR